MDREQWIIDHFGPKARPTSSTCPICSTDYMDYRYDGGSHGLYICTMGCGAEWVVDLNGAMWPREHPDDSA